MAFFVAKVDLGHYMTQLHDLHSVAMRDGLYTISAVVDCREAEVGGDEQACTEEKQGKKSFYSQLQ